MSQRQLIVNLAMQLVAYTTSPVLFLFSHVADSQWFILLAIIMTVVTAIVAAHRNEDDEDIILIQFIYWTGSWCFVTRTYGEWLRVHARIDKIQAPYFYLGLIRHAFHSARLLTTRCSCPFQHSNLPLPCALLGYRFPQPHWV